jgi:hypothetical protein
MYIPKGQGCSMPEPCCWMLQIRISIRLCPRQLVLLQRSLWWTPGTRLEHVRRQEEVRQGRRQGWTCGSSSINDWVEADQ